MRNDGADRRAYLGAADPDPVGLFNAAGRSPFLLIGDHAGNAIPAALGTLGLSSQDRARHIAWDIGVQGIGMALARRLDAPFIHQRYSRLVIDCNRDPASGEAVPVLVDGTAIKANAMIGTIEREGRIDAIHAPYQQAIADMVVARADDGHPVILISLHSFTGEMAGFRRPWHAGILHWRGRSDFARALLKALRRNDALLIGDNEPYRMDATDYTVPRHAFVRDIPYAEIEIRQDMIADTEGQGRWSDLLERALLQAMESRSA